MDTICIQKNTRFFRFGLWKTRFFRGFAIRDDRNSYVMDRAHLDIPLEIKIEISKKSFFRVRKGNHFKVNRSFVSFTKPQDT